MAHGFTRKGKRYAARLEADEIAIITGVMEQTRALLAPEVPPTGDPFHDLIAEIDGAFGPPPAAARPDWPQSPALADGESAAQPLRDPALDRLLPDAYRGDPAVAAEFRRLTEQGLRQRKYATLTAAMEALRSGDEQGRLVLDQAQAQAVAVALTDTRLLLGERLGVRTEADAAALSRLVDTEPDSPAAYAAAVYEFLTWLQESLTVALLGRRSFR
ncbi:MAG: DUF2017 domain-containing protein [Dermatophilaceae bacterium]